MYIHGFFFILYLNDDLQNTKNSFQDGVNSLYDKLKGLGFTPTSKSLDDILKAIDKMYTDRYNSGYSAGRTQGQADVVANPGGYGISVGAIDSVAISKHDSGSYWYMVVKINGVNKLNKPWNSLPFGTFFTAP